MAVKTPKSKRFTKGLKPKHIIAIKALLTNPDLNAVAAEAGVTYDTLRHWMRHPVFMQEFRTHGTAVLNHVMELARNNSNAAVAVIMSQMNSDDEDVKFRAAEKILSLIFAWTKEVDTLARLERLEKKAGVE